METVLTDKEIEPTEETLQEVLKKSHPHFVRLREYSNGHNQEWKYYNKKSGWVFKVSNKKRALFYVTPLNGKFHFGMAVNENDRGTILAENVFEPIQNELSSAKKVMEGYPIRLDIKTKKDLERIVQVLKVVGRL